MAATSEGGGCTNYWLEIKDDPRHGVAMLDMEDETNARGIKDMLQSCFGVPAEALRIQLPDGQDVDDAVAIKSLPLPCPPLLFVVPSTPEQLAQLDLSLLQELDSVDESAPTTSTAQLPLALQRERLLEQRRRADSEAAPADVPRLCSVFDVRCVEPGAASSGLVILLSSLQQSGQLDELLSVLERVPAACLLSVLPLLIAMREPLVTAFVGRQVLHSAAIAQRVKLLSNERPAFAHVHDLVAHVPLSDLILACQRPDAGFLETGQRIELASVHPISGAPISAVRVDHVFRSLARPVILSFEGPPASTQLACGALSRLLMKRGEDIYEEASVQVLFRLMNEVWEQELPDELRPFVCSFREVPASPTLGFLQIIEGCRDLEVVERGDFQLVVNHENFIRTTCGWCLAAYVLGLSDRHRENTLVRLDDSSAIPIDFGFMLGKTAPSVNAYMITVSEEMHRYLLRRGAWSAFGAMFLAGFWALRNNIELLVATASQLFDGHRDTAFVRKFVRHRLLSREATPELAVKRALKRLRHAPVCSDTKSKINNHAKNKRFLAEHGGHFMVRFIIRRAVEADPELKTGRHIHLAKAKYDLPDAFPPDTPPDLLAIFDRLRRGPPKEPAFEWSVFRRSESRKGQLVAARNLSHEAYDGDSEQPAPSKSSSALGIPRLMKTLSNILPKKKPEEPSPRTLGASDGEQKTTSPRQPQ